MKFSNQFIPHVIVLVLVILAVLVCFVPCVMPYSRGTNYASYEGMETQGDENQHPSEVLKTEEEKKKESEPDAVVSGNTVSSVSDVETKESFTFGIGNLISLNGNASPMSQKEHFGLLNGLGNVFSFSAKTESFVPLSASSGPVGTYSDVIDKFSQVKTFGTEGVNGCVSSGLSNSKGYLCLTPELISALKTRGGNSQ